MPSRLNNIFGISSSQGLVSRDGMIGAGPLNDRNGPACRTALDTAKVLDVIAGYDERDDLTVYSVGRIPEEGFAANAAETSLEGITIGVVREYMDRSLFTAADEQSIALIEAAVEDLRELGATIVDPGEGGALFTECLAQYVPQNLHASFIREYPELFPEGADHIKTLVDLYYDPSLMPENGPTLRDFNVSGGATGESRYYFNRYLRNRGDAVITDLAALAANSSYYVDEMSRDTRFRDVQATLTGNDDLTLDLQAARANRMGIQQSVMQCMMVMGLDAITYPTGNIPATLIKGVVEPDVNGRSHQAWTLLGQMGFPAMTVPAGFTTEVYDRVRDPAAEGGTRLVGPTPAVLPVGIDFLAMPFNEAMLFRIASAYEAATHHRTSPPGFGPLE